MGAYKEFTRKELYDLGLVTPDERREFACNPSARGLETMTCARTAPAKSIAISAH